MRRSTLLCPGQCAAGGQRPGFKWTVQTRDAGGTQALYRYRWAVELCFCALLSLHWGVGGAPSLRFGRHQALSCTTYILFTTLAVKSSWVHGMASTATFSTALFECCTTAVFCWATRRFAGPAGSCSVGSSWYSELVGQTGRYSVNWPANSASCASRPAGALRRREWL